MRIFLDAAITALYRRPMDSPRRTITHCAWGIVLFRSQSAERDVPHHARFLSKRTQTGQSMSRISGGECPIQRQTVRNHSNFPLRLSEHQPLFQSNLGTEECLSGA